MRHRVLGSLKISGIGDDTLSSDIRSILERHYGMVRLQQEIRDRWYRYYLITSGAILSLAGAAFATSLNAAAQVLKSNSGQTAETFDIFTSVMGALGWLLSSAFGLISALGLLFLAIYLFQIVNYELFYLSIDQCYRALNDVHSRTIESLGIPNPFVFTHSPERRPGLSWLRRSLRRLIDPKLWATDFFTNLVAIFLNSVSAAAAFLSYKTWRIALAKNEIVISDISKDMWNYILFFMMFLISQVVLRQLVMAGLLARVECLFDRRIEESRGSETHPPS